MKTTMPNLFLGGPKSGPHRDLRDLAPLRATAHFQTKGPLGHEVIITPIDCVPKGLLFLLVHEDQVLMHTVSTDVEPPSPVDFVRAAFILDFWSNTSARLFRPSEKRLRPEQDWTPLMQDCSSLGFWLKGAVALHQNDQDFNERLYRPSKQELDVKGMPNDTLGTVKDVSLRFLHGSLQDQSPITVGDLGKDLSHLLTRTERAKSSDWLNANHYIKQSFTYQYCLNDDVYTFECYNQLPLTAHPFQVVFGEHTCFKLSVVHEGKGPDFVRTLLRTGEPQFTRPVHLFKPKK
jgi:hypothetical protein